MKFTKKFMQDIVWGGNDEAEVISNELVGHSRWSVHHEVVFKYEGKFYISRYSIGATENQDEHPYEWDGAEIECKEVVPVEKTITVYEPIDIAG